MVWPVDLADPVNDTSTANSFISGMASIDGDQVYTNRDVAMAKYAAIQTQNAVTLKAFLMDCAAKPSCPPGLVAVAFGHGTTFDIDTGCR